MADRAGKGPKRNRQSPNSPELVRPTKPGGGAEGPSKGTRAGRGAGDGGVFANDRDESAAVVGAIQEAIESLDAMAPEAAAIAAAKSALVPLETIQLYAESAEPPDCMAKLVARLNRESALLARYFIDSPPVQKTLRSLHSGPVSHAGETGTSYVDVVAKLLKRRLSWLHTAASRFMSPGYFGASLENVWLPVNANALIQNWSEAREYLAGLTPINADELHCQLEREEDAATARKPDGAANKASIEIPPEPQQAIEDLSVAVCHGGDVLSDALRRFRDSVGPTRPITVDREVLQRACNTAEFLENNAHNLTDESKNKLSAELWRYAEELAGETEDSAKPTHSKKGEKGPTKKEIANAKALPLLQKDPSLCHRPTELSKLVGCSPGYIWRLPAVEAARKTTPNPKQPKFAGGSEVVEILGSDAQALAKLIEEQEADHEASPLSKDGKSPKVRRKL